MSYRIMCAYDASSAADRAFEFSLSLVKQFGGELHVLSVFQPTEETRESEPAALVQAARDEFDPAIERLRAQAVAANLPVTFDLSVGYLAHQILTEAARLGIDHIVLGAGGKRGWMGSAAHRIVALAHCAVTVVR